MGYFNLFFYIKKIYYVLKRSKFFKIILITAIITFIFSRVCFGASSQTEDIYYETIERQTQLQNNFIFFMLDNYYRNTDAWNNELQPFVDLILHENYNLYFNYTYRSSYSEWRVSLFHLQDGNTSPGYSQASMVNDTYTVLSYSNTNCIRYIFHYLPDDDLLQTSIVNPYSLTCPYASAEIKTPLFYDFINLYRGESNYNSILNDISNYLDSIDEINSDLLSALNSLSSTLNQISSNTSTNYSQQISAISGKIDDILDDNQDIISQNVEMIQQQEEINNNIQETNEKIEVLKDTITDDTIESGADDLPSTDVQDPTQNGIDNIFQNIYNAFCVGEAQDIVFPIPFTNKNITLSPYYVRDMLNNNGAIWVYGLIQAFWGYLIGRFIVKDIMNKITKIKSGNIEDIETTNIKGDML